MSHILGKCNIPDCGHSAAKYICSDCIGNYKDSELAKILKRVKCYINEKKLYDKPEYECYKSECIYDIKQEDKILKQNCNIFGCNSNGYKFQGQIQPFCQKCYHLDIDSQLQKLLNIYKNKIKNIKKSIKSKNGKNKVKKTIKKFKIENGKKKLINKVIKYE